MNVKDIENYMDIRNYYSFPQHVYFSVGIFDSFTNGAAWYQNFRLDVVMRKLLLIYS